MREMKVGDLVRFKQLPEYEGSGPSGFVMKVDKQFYGAKTAYKIKDIDRGQGFGTAMVHCIGLTKDGIQDRVLVLWSCNQEWEYCYSKDLEIISEK